MKHKSDEWWEQTSQNKYGRKLSEREMAQFRASYSSLSDLDYEGTPAKPRKKQEPGWAWKLQNPFPKSKGSKSQMKNILCKICGIVIQTAVLQRKMCFDCRREKQRKVARERYTSQRKRFG